MRIACVGGGPAGLYFSILMKLWDPANDVVVFERGKEGVTHGWGVTMEQEFLARARRSARWFENVPRYAGLTSRQFAAVLHTRQAPLLGKLPPRLQDIRRRAGLAGQPRSLAG